MTAPFNWTVDRSAWPPRARVKPPYSLTRVAIARSCALRVIFEASRAFEPLLSFDARIGTAMHATLEHFAAHPVAGNGEATLNHVRTVFGLELERGRAEAALRPREARLAENRERSELALSAVLRAVVSGSQAARGVWRGGSPSERASPEETQKLWVERAVGTRDGVFSGQVDRAEREGDALTLYDYKSSLLPDVPERYERQLLMYAAMWAQTTGESPTHGVLVYPLQGRKHRVDLAIERVTRALEESYAVVRRFEQSPSPKALAAPGDVCKVCAFKPWCEPFWNWVQVADLPTALERASLGFEGAIEHLERRAEQLVLRVRWHPRSVLLMVAPWAALAGVHGLAIGATVRVTGATVRGQVTAPRAVWHEHTEVYTVLP